MTGWSMEMTSIQSYSGVAAYSPISAPTSGQQQTQSAAPSKGGSQSSLDVSQYNKALSTLAGMLLGIGGGDHDGDKDGGMKAAQGAGAQETSGDDVTPDGDADDAKASAAQPNVSDTGTYDFGGATA